MVFLFPLSQHSHTAKQTLSFICMENNLTARYAKTTQLLQRKKDELEQVFEEARSLESENAKLHAQNRELKSRNLELESAAKSMSYEFATLETQLKKQQAKLQQYIDQDASGQGTSRPRQQDVQRIGRLTDELTDLRKKFDSSEEQVRALTDTRTRLQRQVDDASGELIALRSEVAALRESKHAADVEVARLAELEKMLSSKLNEMRIEKDSYVRDSTMLSQIEADALGGLRHEIATLSADNHRLMDELEDERHKTSELRSEVERFDEIIRKQRYLADGQLKISRDEVAALNTQNDTLLAEIKRLMVERDQLRKKVAAALQPPEKSATPPPAAAAPQIVIAAPPPPPKPDLVTRGTMTVEVYIGSTGGAMIGSPSSGRRQLSPEQAPSVELDELLLNKRSAENEIARLEARIQVLLHDHEKLSALLLEKDEAAKLQDERAHLQKVEIDRLHNQLAHQAAPATPLEKLVYAPHDILSDGPVVRHDLDELESIVSRVLVTGTTVYRAVSDALQSQTQSLLDSAESIDGASSCSDTDDVRRHSRSESVGGTVVPIVPFTKFRNTTLNRIMEQVGGLKYVIKKIGKSALRMPQRARPNPDTQFKSYMRSDNDPADQNVSRPSFDVDAWLLQRKAQHLQRPVPQAADVETPHFGLRRPPGDGLLYETGTSLLEVVDELKRTPVSSRSRRQSKW